MDKLGATAVRQSHHRPNYADYAAMHDNTLPHLPWELYRRWKSYGKATAVISLNGEHTSYSRLVWSIEGKYAALSKDGLQARDVVALGGGMCVDMIATVVACWLRGLTVALLDENLPEGRRRRLLDIVAPSLVIGHDEGAGGLCNAQYRTYDRMMGVPEPIRSAVTVDAAYIVFTSGSTGDPKPIMGSHQGLAHFICWQSREFTIGRHERFAQLTAVGFDVIYRSVFTPLFCGAQLWIPPYTVSDGEMMLKWLCHHQINALHIVPCIIKAWLSLCAEMVLPDLRWIFSAGETLHGKVLKDMCRQWGFSGQLVNLYGPSETTLAKCFYRCKPADAVRSVMPAGEPLPNTEVWVMDKQRRCAPGEQGEVVIRTPYRSLGYLSAAGLVENNMFRSTPNMQHPSDQLYYTGDLGHYDEHGLLYLNGRVDDQIKINGQRIEPGELEAFLHRIPQVEEAAVCYHDGLVAYLAAPESLSVHEINRQLSQAFPAVMRPRVIIRRQLPTNANGKVDRLALKSLLKRSAIVRPDMAPCGRTETLMVQLWQKHLELEAVVARDDDFFSLGGNSISAIIMGAELNRLTGKQVPLKGLFQFSQLAEFCHYVDGIECRSVPSENGGISHDAASAHHPFGLTDVQRAYLIGRDSAFELGGVSTHNYREDRFAQLDVALLTWCVNQLVRRHSALRTVYSLEGSQRVLAETPLIQITVQDVSCASPERQRDALLLWRWELERQMFDAATFPLFEWRVTQYESHCVLHFSYDVLIMDARSMRIFMSELNELYRRPEQALPPLSITFRDYQLALEQLKTTARYREDRRYWYERLPELPYGPSLATACRPDRGSTLDFKRQGFRLDAKLWQRLQARTRREKISTTVPFLALYGQVLARWSADEHFLINLTLFQREDVHPDTQRLVGDFTVLSLFEYRQRQETARQLMRGVQERLWDNLSHTLFTGVEVQSALARHNQHQGGKLIAPVVLTSMLGFPHSDDGFLTDGYQGRDYARTQTSQVWLDNNLYERDGSLVVEWDYVSQLFDEQQISDMLNAYQLAIVSLANGDWDKPLHIPLPTADELLLRQYNDTACSDGMLTATLHEQFLLSAERFPDAPAVVTASGGQTTSYRQIRAKAAQLANRLQSCGVSRKERVMICAEKGPWLVFGALGILMAGAVFVPVNVQWPVGRLRAIILQAGIRHLVLTKQQLRRLSQHQEIAAEVGITISFHDVSNGDELADFDTVPPAVSVAMNDPAYVIFTSGSTGKPKGVCISHGGVLNTLRDINVRLALTSDDRTLCLSNISFDLAIYDVFGPLMLGGAVVMPAERALDRPDALIQLLDDCDVSVYNSAPAVMALLVQSAGGSRHGGVRHVLLSGDFIPLDLPERIKKTFPAAKVLSLGGATEGSIWSICYSLTLVEKHWTSIPYGKPLLNQQVWILDANRQPCPIGVTGEIYLAGCGVALGYEADAEKTAACFGQLPDGQRYYRTGDQGIMHRAGYVEILGRLDNQVKINGFRVELGEIDSVLQSHSAVQTSLSRVIAHGAAPAQKFLVSYVVPLVFDRLAFKLEKRGIRNGIKTPGTVKDLKPLTPQTILSDAARRALARKSYRHYHAGQQLTLEVLQPLMRITVQPENSKHRLRMSRATLWAELAVLLTPLRAFKHRIEGLNKYIYPSAGGLYPVRTYVTLSRAWGGCGGHYYYHPENHALMQLANDAELLPETGIYLHLSAFLPAIEPEYHEYAPAYSSLEAGGMLALLAEYGRLSPVAPLPAACWSEDEFYLASYLLDEEGGTDIPLQLPEYTLLLLKTTAGWDGYCFQEGHFQRCGHVPLNFKFGQNESNDAIIGQALALLLLPPAIPTLEQGRLVQRISENLLTASLGSCLLGQVKLQDQLLSYTWGRDFSGALAIGKITTEDTTNGEVENINVVTALPDELRAHLQRHLPTYMVPDDIICVPTLPLTANGKVDVKALPYPPSRLNGNDESCPPGDQYEESLQALWTEVLEAAPRGNVHADFFVHGGNSLDAILLAMKISQRFVRKVATPFVYKHRTIAQQAKAIVQCVLQPTFDHIELNEAKHSKRLVLFSPSDSGAEAYYALAQALADDVDVIGINHFFINYPEKVTADWSVALDFYCRQIGDVVQQAPEVPVWLGGWSMGGNIAVAVAERLVGCPQIRSQLIIFDSLPGYNPAERQVRENTTDIWSPYHPDNITYRQFAMAGYSRRHYYHYVDCLFDHLSAMQVERCRHPLLLVKCLEPLGHYRSDEPDNGWGRIADKVAVQGVKAHHYNLLIDKDAIQEVASIVRRALQQEPCLEIM